MPAPDDPIARAREGLGWAARNASRFASDVSGRADTAFRARVRTARQGSLLPEADDDERARASEAWSSLSSAATQIAVALAKGGTGADVLVDPGLALVRAALGIEDGQRQLLTTIDRNVVILRDGAFATGRLYLGEAERLAGEPERARDFVERAQSSFYEAYSLAAAPLDRAIVGMHVGLTSLLLHRPDDARYWLEQAYEQASGVARTLAQATGDTAVLKSNWGRAAATFYYPVGAVLLVRKGFKVRNDERARKGLEQVLPAVACIAEIHNALPGVTPVALPG